MIKPMTYKTCSMNYTSVPQTDNRSAIFKLTTMTDVEVVSGAMEEQLVEMTSVYGYAIVTSRTVVMVTITSKLLSVLQSISCVCIACLSAITLNKHFLLLNYFLCLIIVRILCIVTVITGCNDTH